MAIPCSSVCALPLEDALGIGRRAALALSRAHGKDLIHCDLKPDSLMRAKIGASSSHVALRSH